MPASVILGIWDGHDAGAALLVDGRLRAAINEERLSRRKLEIRFPVAAIKACLGMAGLAPRDVRVVAASTADPAKALGRLLPWTKERYYAVRRRKALPGPLAGLTQIAKQRLTPLRPNAASRYISRTMLRRELTHVGLDHASLAIFDHHVCHALSAAHGSGFDQCAVLTIDGLGDGVSASVSDFDSGQLQLRAVSRAGDSLGVFFEHATRLLNMRELEDEGKVMALANYAAPVPDEENPLLELFAVDRGRLRSAVPAHKWERRLREVLWSRANEQFAFLAQRTVERVCQQLVASSIELTGRRRIALAGGVASNVKANRLVRLMPQVDRVYVFPHMGDGGLALGAALAAAETTGDAVHLGLESLGLGPEYGRPDIVAAARDAGIELHEPTDVAADVGVRLIAGQVICWFQGRMEYGPRALGGRSVLARPDRLDLKDRLNLILKRRVWYQPFCPSVLESEAPRLFEDWTSEGLLNRHMTMAYSVAAALRPAMAGVINADGSCRPQLVCDAGQEPLAPILRALRQATGVGAVLNTSFNIHGEPLVCTPAEAISVFRRSGADALAIGPFVVSR